METSNGVTRKSFLAQAQMALIALLGAPAVAHAAPAKQEETKGAPPNVDPKLYLQEFTAFNNKTLEQKVQELADREEIRELIGKYAHRIARRMGVADMFTEDGVFITRAPGRPVHYVNGRAALTKLYSDPAPLNAGQPKPMIHNYVIVIDGDNAKGVCSNELRIIEGGKSIIASGYYDDIFRRVDGRWKFVVRDANFLHWVPIQQGWAKSNKVEAE